MHVTKIQCVIPNNVFKNKRNVRKLAHFVSPKMKRYKEIEIQNYKFV